jgi:hypothetical protein
MLIVIFLPGGLMEGGSRIRAAFSRKPADKKRARRLQPAE